MSALKGKNLLRSKFFPLRVDLPLLQGSKQEVTKVVPLCAYMAENMEGYPYTLFFTDFLTFAIDCLLDSAFSAFGVGLGSGEGVSLGLGLGLLSDSLLAGLAILDIPDSLAGVGRPDWGAMFASSFGTLVALLGVGPISARFSVPEKMRK